MIPKLPFLRRNHHERVVLTPENKPMSPKQDSGVASPWHRDYPSLSKRCYPTLDVQPIPIDLMLRRKPVPVQTTVAITPSGQTSPVAALAPVLSSPVSMQTSTSIPLSTARQPSPLSISTPQSTSPVSTAPTSPVSSQASSSAKTRLLYSNFEDPCGFPGLNKGLFGRDSTSAPQLPPLDIDSTPLKSRKGKACNIPTPPKKRPKIEKVAQSSRSAAECSDATPSKAQKVLGRKIGPGEASQAKQVEIVKKSVDRKSRIPSIFRSLSKFGLSGVKDEDYHDALPNRPLLATTPSPTRSKFPLISAPSSFVHASGSSILMGESPRTTPESPSPPHTPHTLSSISEANEPPAKPKAMARDENVTYKTPAVLRAADFNFSNEDSGKAEAFQSRSKIPRSPNGGLSTTPDRSARRYLPEAQEDETSEKNFSTPSRLLLARKVYGKQAKDDVQAMMATPQHRSMLPTAGKTNTPNNS